MSCSSPNGLAFGLANGNVPGESDDFASHCAVLTGPRRALEAFVFPDFRSLAPAALDAAKIASRVSQNRMVYLAAMVSTRVQIIGKNRPGASSEPMSRG